MARIEGIKQGGSLLAKIAFFFSKKKVGKVTTPVRITALHTQILKGYGRMELAQDKANEVAPEIKILAQVRAATIIGCPY